MGDAVRQRVDELHAAAIAGIGDGVVYSDARFAASGYAAVLRIIADADVAVAVTDAARDAADELYAAARATARSAKAARTSWR